MGANAYSAKLLNISLGSIVFSTRQWSLDNTSKTVDVTTGESGGYEEYVVGIEGGAGSARGFCDATTAPVKPTAAVLATMFDGKYTVTCNVIVTKLTVNPTVDGGSEISIDFVKTI